MTVELDLSAPGLQVVVGSSETGPTILTVLSRPTVNSPTGNVLLVIKFEDATDAAFKLAEWQRQLAPHIPTDPGDAF